VVEVEQKKLGTRGVWAEETKTSPPRNKMGRGRSTQKGRGRVLRVEKRKFYVVGNSQVQTFEKKKMLDRGRKWDPVNLKKERGVLEPKVPLMIQIEKKKTSSVDQTERGKTRGGGVQVPSGVQSQKRLELDGLS